MPTLFSKAKSTINEHIKNIFGEKELIKEQVMRKFGNSDFSFNLVKPYNTEVEKHFIEAKKEIRKLTNKREKNDLQQICCLFSVTVHRKQTTDSGKSLERLRQQPKLTIPELSEELEISTRAVEKQLSKLKKENKIKRIGPAKGGHWEVTE
ncbi:MAG: HTH domain-containing protein [SAR324 cluster bacterium]|nr:HTH domain-containing protein [SAR324 cluster bacterium]